MFFLCILLIFGSPASAQPIKSVSLRGTVLGFNANSDSFYAAASLKLIEAQVRNTIEQDLFNVRWGGRISLTPFSLTGTSDSIRALANIDTDFGNCRVELTIKMQRAKLRAFKLTPEPANVNCHLHPVLQKFGLERQLETTIKKELTPLLSPKGIPGIPDLSSGSIDLTALLEVIEIQGGVCTEFGQPFVCFKLFLPQGTINTLVDLASSLAPAPQGPLTQADVQELKSLRQELLNGTPNAPLKSSNQHSGFAYPAKLKAGEFDDGDAAIFNGLLCASGQQIGCDAVQRMQSSSGQIWRSPDRRNTWTDQSQFSGDQFLGVLLYLTRIQDKDLLTRWLTFIARNSKPQPDLGTSIAVGFKSCISEGRSTHNCLLGGSEWNWLRYFANKLGVAHSLPIKQTDPEQIYGYSTKALPLLAASAELGPPLHLVGIQLYLHKLTGSWNNDELQKSADILLLRQPENAFFRFLSHGASHDAATTVLKWCRNRTPDNLGEWIWEREQGSVDWNHSMSWDCVFMINALIGADATPASPQGPDLDKISQLAFLDGIPSQQQCSSPTSSEAYAISGNRVTNDAAAIRGPIVAGLVKTGASTNAHRWLLRDTDYSVARSEPLVSAPFVLGRPLQISGDGRAYLTEQRSGKEPRTPLIEYQDRPAELSWLTLFHDGVPLEEGLMATSVGNGDIESTFVEFVGTLRSGYNQRDKPSSVSRQIHFRLKDNQGQTKSGYRYQPLRLNQPNPISSPLTAAAVSTDGTEILANSKSGAYIWSELQGWKQAPGSGDGLFKVATVSSNGAYVLGYTNHQFGPAIIAPVASGTSVRTWPPQNPQQSVFKLIAISPDGNTIIANGTLSGTSETSFVWTAATGWTSLADHVAKNGVTLPQNVKIVSVNAMSIDGRSFVGAAAYSGPNCARVAYIVRTN
ncbi:hypothetical protein MA20_07685 [Bradyrhizobium japonicum]|uniref:Uncharacterized protein n=1 Tax=Bradyrhizobium japonicum TaxID=375 RepID=A0A0A3Y199_BRAJP|nr:hypothetical protein MA20_07685 [Bradyrhizobium japonicum]